MTKLVPIVATCFILVASIGSLYAKPPVPPSEASPVKSDWSARAKTWFKSADNKGHRKEMRAVTKALRKPCRYCHTPDFKGYTEKLLISQQMMALSAENGVQCNECHAGKQGLTDLGKFSAKMWKWSIEKTLFCNDCHTKQSKFKGLTERGKKAVGEWNKRKKKP